ncbi:MAG: hypothetical protein ABRQ38_07510 [Candidatus Eremiobacterota bacterium]
MGKSYKWKRFWCPREGNLNLSDGGYLYDPDSEWGKIYNPDIVSFEAIIDVPCLVLIGEPGIGKSHSILEKHRELEKLGTNTLLFELRSYGEDLFKDEKFLSWVENKYNFHLFIDDLDECMLRINNIPDILCRKFKEYKEYHNHLPKLRIACRTGVWPDNLEEGLTELWGKDNVKVYELAPLRRIDVIEAAKYNELEPDTFLRQIQEKEAVPLAIKPITLNFLLNTYLKDKQLPANKTELYTKGCRLLCEEQNKRRRGANVKGKFPVDHRMIIAGRIATVMTFANKDAIWTETDQGNIPETDVKIEQLCKGSEFIDKQIIVTESIIDETLKITGLFSSRGVNRTGWSHQTYKEFLAAWYLDQHKLSLAQIKSLLIHPEGKVVPQLYETAAWLAGMNDDVFKEITKIEPEILLRGDLTKLKEKDRKELVSILLTLYEEEKLLYDIWLSGYYRKLFHSSMEEQLKPYLCDKNKNPAVIKAAINMARECNLIILQNELAYIALDKSQTEVIRVEATRAISQFAKKGKLDDKVKSKLKILATGQGEDDSFDQLKGYSLMALWPKYMRAEELFKNLTQPKYKPFLGPYQMFISRGIIIHLQETDLPTALQWLKKQTSEHISDYEFKQLSDSIILKTLDYLNNQNIMEAFAEFIIDRLKNCHSIIGQDAISKFKSKLDSGKRRQLVETILNMLSDLEKELRKIYADDIVINSDFTWLVEKFKSEKSREKQENLAELIYMTFYMGNTGQIKDILRLSQTSEIIFNKFSIWLKPVDLNSPEAEKMKENYLWWQKREIKKQEKPLLSPTPVERIGSCLKNFEKDDLNAWWQLNREMTLKPDSTHYMGDGYSDLRTLPGWEMADEITRKRIIEAAKIYILSQDPETEIWFNKNIIYRPAYAGYRALILLFHENPEYLYTLPVEVWKKWSSIIISYPYYDYPIPISPQGQDSNYNINDKDVHCEIVKLAYQYAPDDILKYLFSMIDQQNKELAHYRFIEKIVTIWNNGNFYLTFFNHLLLHKDSKFITIKMLPPTEFTIYISIFLTSLQESPHKNFIVSNFLDKIKYCWHDKYLKNALLEKAKDKSLEQETLADLLTELLKNNVEGTREFAETLISPLPSESLEYSKSIAAAGRLMLHTDDAGWPVVWPAIKENPEYGREVMFSFLRNHGSHESSLFHKLREIELAKLYVWISREYPHSEDLKHEGVFTPVFRDDIAYWRDSILYYLENCGKPEACNAIQYIINELPALQWMPQILFNTKKNVRRNNWNPPEPEEILELCSNKEKRLILSGDQLLDVLMESLERFQIKLQDETPAAIDLWNECKTGKNKYTYTPKQENRLSDYIKRYFKDDLKEKKIILNREVEIRAGYGEGHGEETDIHVDTFNEDEPINAIIEVKGCWNKGLFKDIEKQLVKRYLENNQCRHGLYLVIWFNCLQWDKNDNRRKKAYEKKRNNIEKLLEDLKKQAKNLSQEGLHIEAFVINASLHHKEEIQ